MLFHYFRRPNRHTHIHICLSCHKLIRSIRLACSRLRIRMRDHFFFFLEADAIRANSRQWFVSGATSSNNSFWCRMRWHVRRWILWRIWDVFFFSTVRFDRTRARGRLLFRNVRLISARDCIINRSLRATLSATLTLMAFLKFTKCYLVWPHRVLVFVLIIVSLFSVTLTSHTFSLKCGSRQQNMLNLNKGNNNTM